MKWGKFKTLFGTEGDALSIGTWWSLVLGVVVSLLAFDIGQNAYQRVAGTAIAQRAGAGNIEPLGNVQVAQGNPVGEVY